MIVIPQIIGVAMLRGTYIVEKLKSMQLDVNDETKRKIEEEGIYHFTSKENAEKIMTSGVILPTKGILDNHFSKSKDGSRFADYVYMFAGIPSDYDLTKNLPVLRSGDGTIYAIKHSPDKFDLGNYTQRFEDGALTYEGVLNIQNSHPEIVRFIQRNNKLIQIPLNMEIKEKVNNNPKEVLSRIIKVVKTSYSEMFKMATFYDKNHKLKDLRQKRKLENKLIKQYNQEKQRKTIKIQKDGKTYFVRTMNDKILDGKVLSEFEVLENGFEVGNKLYCEQLDVSTISQEHLVAFFEQHIGSKEDEYIGRPQIKNGEMQTYIDEEYRKHFEEKQKIQKSPAQFTDSKKYKITMRSLVKKTIGTAIELKDEALRQVNYERKNLLQEGQEKI